MKIDRENRTRLAEVTRRFLAEEIGAFEFDDKIIDIQSQSDDPTLTSVAHSLWYFYDDLKDHTAALCKAEWDYIQRLLLILESDAEVHVESRWIWTPVQFAAMFILVVFVACVFWPGFGYHLIFVSIPFGLLSILLSLWRGRCMRRLASGDPSLEPFVSISEIRTVRMAARRFRKQPYPTHLKDKRVFSAAELRLNTVTKYGAWLIYAPIVLLFQSLPFVERSTSVRIGPEAQFAGAS